MLVDWLKDSYQNALFSAIANAAAARDVDVIAFTGGVLGSNELFWSQRNLLYEIAGPASVDALIVTAGTMGNLIGAPRLQLYLERYRPLPMVATAYQLHGIPSITVDNDSGMRDMVRHLIQHHQYQRIAFVRGPAGNEEAERRFAIYRECLAEAGLPLDPALVSAEGTFLYASGERAAATWLDTGTGLQAIVSANDNMALGAAELLITRGLRIPEDVAVVGFDDTEEAWFSTPPLTTVRQPIEEIGAEAVRLAVALAAGEAAPDRVRLPTRMVIRRSCGCSRREIQASAAGEIDSGEQVEGRRRMRLGRVALALGNASRAFAGRVEANDVADTLAKFLPDLQIPSCFVSLYEDPAHPRAEARIQLAYDPSRPGVEAHVGCRFPTDTLAPDGSLFGERRRTYVVEPLFFEEHQLGMALFEVGPQEGLIYELLRDYLSGAMGRALLEETMQTLRRRQLAEKEQAEREMKIASRIQTMILPSDMRVVGLEIAATMVPAANVGGDYYDVIRTDHGAWIGVGDVAGHGLSAGLVMLMIQSTVAGTVRATPDASPHAVLRTVNEVIFDNVRCRLGETRQATFTILKYDPSGLVTFAGAHEDIFVYRARDRRCEIVETEGAWLGVSPQIQPRHQVNGSLRLEPGDVMLLLSDGVLEARNLNRELFGQDRVCKELVRFGQAPATKIRDGILNAVDRWAAIHDDDMSVLVARYAPDP